MTEIGPHRDARGRITQILPNSESLRRACFIECQQVAEESALFRSTQKLLVRAKETGWQHNVRTSVHRDCGAMIVVAAFKDLLPCSLQNLANFSIFEPAVGTNLSSKFVPKFNQTGMGNSAWQTLHFKTPSPHLQFRSCEDRQPRHR